MKGPHSRRHFGVLATFLGDWGNHDAMFNVLLSIYLVLLRFRIVNIGRRIWIFVNVVFETLLAVFLASNLVILEE